jgi:hypothetical protein
MVKLASVSSMRIGSSPRAAIRSAASSRQASLGLRREQDKLANGNDSSVISGYVPLSVAYLIGETRVPALNYALAQSTLDGSSAMELFTKLFSDLLAFVYHCLDRFVVHGYLTGLSCPEEVVNLFRQVVGAPV